MSLYVEDGLGSGIYFPLGRISLKVGEYKYHIVGMQFEVLKYIDYGISKDKEHKYVLRASDNLDLHKLKDDELKKWKIKLHDNLYRQIIDIIFKHNTEVQESL